MESIVVIKDCESHTPVLGKTNFTAGTEVLSSDPNYWPLLWAGLAAPNVKIAHHTKVEVTDIAARLKKDRDRAKESE